MWKQKTWPSRWFSFAIPAILMLSGCGGPPSSMEGSEVDPILGFGSSPSEAPILEEAVPNEDANDPLPETPEPQPVEEASPEPEPPEETPVVLPEEPAPDPEPEPEEEEPEPANPNSELCEEGPNKVTPKSAKVYYGTDSPQVLPLNEGQKMAVGTFWSCTGLLVTPTWVLTAEHCNLWSGDEFCVGPDPTNPSVCTPVHSVHEHGWADIAIVELAWSPLEVLPQIVPIPLFTDALDNSWLGKLVEAAGYGSQEDGGYGEREFTAEPIAWLSEDTVAIDGQGISGACFGDSGGPLMTVANDGSVRVIGALSGGDEWCTGVDMYTRVDAFRDWLESWTGPTQAPGPQPCGDVDVKGKCSANGNQATYCGDDGFLEVMNCPTGMTCSWYAPVQGWRCLEEAFDPCAGVTHWGSCDGNLLSWCDEGGLFNRNCGDCGETCVPHDSWGYFCIPSTCGDLLFEGHCLDGTVVEWCNRDGMPETKDCAWYGQWCAWIDAETGYFCVD